MSGGSPRVLGRARGPRRLDLRALLREHGGLLVVPLTWAALAAGHISARALLRGELVAMAALTLFAAVTVRVVRRELTPHDASRERGAQQRAILRELELGLVLITGAYFLIHLTGGAVSFLYPLLYALVSFLAILHRARAVALGWLAAIVLLELATGGARAPAHLTFIGFFAAGNSLVLSSLVRRLRRDHARTIEGELARMRQEARDFRLVAARQPLARRHDCREEEETRMAQGAVEGIHAQLEFTLALLRRSLGLRACALLWVHEPATGAARLSLKLSVSDHPELLLDAGCQITGPGVLAPLLREPRALRLALPASRLPPYYRGHGQAQDRARRAAGETVELCAVPLLDDGQLRAILCAERPGAARFDDDAEAQLRTAARHMTRVIRQERALATIERDKYEQEQFYRASELLGEALTLEDVYQKTFAAIAAIASYDLAVLTSYDDRARRHRVLAVHTPDEGGAAGRERWRELAARLEELEFDDGLALVSMALKNRHSMPADDAKFDPDTIVFSPRTRLTRARSLLVLPLIRGEQSLGAITLAASRPGCFHEATREMLRVISHQVSVSLQNARMYSSMEQRATTDGLTGLTNHRAFQERLSTLHDLSERTGQKYSLILTDIDHFKRVNDTYGHPVGDAVLQRVAQVFAGRSRKVDIVARYGGEEFVIVLPHTDAQGAEVFANALREEVAAQVMHGDDGQQFTVTLSMGIAEYPRDGEERRLLIERADQALYRCKEGGRNRVIRWSRSPSA